MGPVGSLVKHIVQAWEWFWSLLALIGEAAKGQLMEVPIASVRVGLALLFLLIEIWCLSLSKKYVMEGAERVTWWNDPRYWAAVILVIQIGLYLCL